MRQNAMKWWVIFLLAVLAGGSLLANAQEMAALREEPPLEEQLEALNLPANQAPALKSEESLYSVQSRYTPLKHRHEISLSGARNLTSDGFLSSNQVGVNYRFHLTERWALGLGATKIFNTLSSSGDYLLENQNLLPDVDFAKYALDVSATFNTFYGKFRLSMDQVLYFDQYISLGGGVVGLNSGSAPAAVADVGFALWLGKKGSLRLGLRDQIYKERRINGEAFSNNLIAHLDIGILLGGAE